MDIRFVKENLFEMHGDAIIYFTDNSLMEETKILIQQAGSEIITPLLKLEGLMTTESKLVPAFKLQSLYVILSCIPDDISTDYKKDLFEKSIENIFQVVTDYNIQSAAIDTLYIMNRYGSDYVNILNKKVAKMRKDYSDFVLYMCRGKIIDK